MNWRTYWLLTKFSLPTYQDMYKDQYEEYAYQFLSSIPFIWGNFSFLKFSCLKSRFHLSQQGLFVLTKRSAKSWNAIGQRKSAVMDFVLFSRKLK